MSYNPIDDLLEPVGDSVSPLSQFQSSEAIASFYGPDNGFEENSTSPSCLIEDGDIRDSFSPVSQSQPVYARSPDLVRFRINIFLVPLEFEIRFLRTSVIRRKM